MTCNLCEPEPCRKLTVAQAVALLLDFCKHFKIDGNERQQIAALLQQQQAQIEAMRLCPNCRFKGRRCNGPPCTTCDRDYSEWQWEGNSV